MKSSEGWVSLINSRKYHYVRGGMSLCRKFMYLGASFEPDTGTVNKNDCAACAKKLRGDAEESNTVFDRSARGEHPLHGADGRVAGKADSAGSAP